MTRVFQFIVVLAFATAGSAVDARAQSRRVYRVEPPKEERAAEPKTNDAAKGESESAAGNEAEGKAENEKPAKGEQPLTGKEVTVRAVIRAKPQAVYPYEARRRGVEGEVKLRIILGSDGKVRDRMEVIEGLPYGLTEQAFKAARRIEFEPARKDGRPVSQYVIVVYHFDLY